MSWRKNVTKTVSRKIQIKQEKRWKKFVHPKQTIKILKGRDYMNVTETTSRKFIHVKQEKGGQRFVHPM